ncbi:MAG: NAD-dependent epimerase/dehydratase family protein [Proteobacteria bacterium]|jgi:UDP-glucose-4-epimerase GalE|nr:NAD-dependent epimerase/dehydratase family protein [Pseudomonadota bacterium]
MAILQFLICFLLSISFIHAQEEENILVTGGAGYIGLSTCRLLKENGYNPVSIDDFSNSQAPTKSWGPIERGTILDKDWLHSKFEQYNFKGIVHLAAKIYVPESVEMPDLYRSINVDGSKNVIELAQDFCVPIVFASTSAVYGTLESDEPVCVTRDLVPESPYAQNKRDTELDLQASTGSYAILRYFNVSGVDRLTDNTDGHSQQLVPALVKAFSKNSVAVTVYGEDYSTRDGSCIRDYLHVVDVARANVKAVQYLLRNNPSVIANIGTGTGFTVKEVVDAVARYTGKDYTIVNPGRRSGDVPIVVADISVAEGTLGWNPEYSSLDKIVGSYY